MKWRVLVSAPYLLMVMDQYSRVFADYGIETIVPPVEERLRESELLRWVSNIDGAICGDDEFTGRVLSQAPRLKVISKWGTGIDSIDVAAAQRLGIEVYRTPDAFTDGVADTVMGYVLCFARRLPWMDRDIRKGDWQKLPSVSLKECTLGVIGVGHIGRAVIRRARAFGMQVLGNDILKIPAEFVRETELKVASKDELLSQSDFVSLNCDLNPTSFHLISTRELSLMKPTAFLINTARGPVVCEPDLADALREKRIAGAALDVFEVEPLPLESALRSFDNVLLAPHNANSSPIAWRKVHENTIRNLIESLQKRSRDGDRAEAVGGR